MSADAFYGDLNKEIDFVNPESGREVQMIYCTALPLSATRGRQSIFQLTSKANFEQIIYLCDWALNKKAALSCP